MITRLLRGSRLAPSVLRFLPSDLSRHWSPLGQPDQRQHSPYHVNDRTEINRPEVAHPVVVEVSHPVQWQRHGQSQDRRDYARYPCPPEAISNPIPGQSRNSDRGGCDEPCRRHVKMRNVGNDRGVKPVQLLPRNAVQRRETDLEPATRERQEEK